MDIDITTSDPEDVLAEVDAIREAIENLGLFVDEITVIDRGL